MSLQINIAEAKAKLSELIERAERGEEVVIARAGKPAVKLVPVTRPDRVLGQFAQWGPIPDDAFDPDPEDAEWADKPDEALVEAGIEKP